MKSRDEALLDRAFKEAERASWLWTAPNPRVGALALLDGHVVGYGHHAAVGQAHAEEAALRDAGAWEQLEALPGRVDEMVVTLEPCSSRGAGKRRPPCVDLLRKAGVKRVLVAATDPDPRHAGAGLKLLAEAGIQVDLADQGQERFEAQNQAFLRGLRHADRPFLLLKWAASLDGRIATADGSSQWITGPAAREEVHGLRASCDATLVGKGTVVQDNPRLNVRVVGEPQTRARILVGAVDHVLPDAALLQIPGPRYWIEAVGTSLPDWADQDDTLVVTKRQEDGRLDLNFAFRTLRQEFGLRRILVEGGAALHGSLLAAGLADAIVRYEAPCLFTGGLPATQGEGVADPSQALMLAEEDRLDLGSDLRRAFLLCG